VLSLAQTVPLKTQKSIFQWHPDDLPTNQLVVSQFVDWMIYGLVILLTIFTNHI